MEMRQLRYFLAVAEELHFGRAARRMHVSQPPLSQQIQALEEELGVRLFDRTSRTVRTTPAGEALRDDVQALLAGLDAAVERARGTARGERGRLRLGFVVSAAATRFPRAVAAYRARCPGVRLELREMGTLLQLRRIESGELDVGLLRNLDGLPEGFDHAPFLHEPQVVALPARHPLARLRVVPLAALAGVPLILYPRRVFPAAYDAIIAACRGAGFSPEVPQEAVGLNTQRALVAAGVGAAIVPASARSEPREGVVYRDVAAGNGATGDAPDLADIRPGLPDIRLDLVWRAGRDDALLRGFLDVVGGYDGEEEGNTTGGHAVLPLTKDSSTADIEDAEGENPAD
ncbi:MAG: LysR family transcriptional regulator [Desulfovibrio sp.]|jgi:DNA-binding transcriptional LysR family regulator|nr:LysR family transcriptional regulator [Desulfovibrio sp.]